MKTSKNQATALAAKGVLIGFTVLGTLMGWAQLSSASTVATVATTALIGQAPQSTTTTPSNTVFNTTGTLRSVRTAPAPLTRTRSSR